MQRKLFSLVMLLGLAACNFPASVPISIGPSTTLTPFQPGLNSTGAETEGAAQNPETATWWVSPELPAMYLDQLSLPDGAQVVEQREQAQLAISVNEGQQISRWVYALVAPFPTLVDEVSFEDIQAAWSGETSETFADSPILMSTETEAVLSAWWGAPATGMVQIHEDAELVGAAWSVQPSWAIIPFDELQPKWKVLVVDGQSPLWKEFDVSTYALSVPIGLSGEESLAAQASQLELGLENNRPPEKMTTVIMTGVTALVRATAWEMERKGITYPAEDIGEFMRQADFTHISNEVPFARDCPPPDPVQRTLIFCSDAEYIGLLEAVGADVIELTGDHFNDWSRDAMLYTLELYKERDWPYYGGGANIEEARQPLLLEHNGNKIAFIGCNGKGGSYASADVDYPGAAECDYELMEQQVRDLVAQGYIVIATFQHNEVYTFVPQPGLIRDFGRISAAGATVVSGSQAHQSHGLEFPREDALIMYGLGNTFFDQRGVVDYGDQALIARHVFYDGRYISTELFTIQFVDFAKPRFMTTEERLTFLTLIFNASIWDYGN